ncbi:MAG: sugar phosphate nucleotidyltransferase [bacterium]
MDTGVNNPASPGYCVIMAGGRGTRFWPLSRAQQPKQFLALSSSRSMLRDTFDRVEPLCGAERILVVTTAGLAVATARELPELPEQNIICEPCGRNTAPCAALGIGLAAKLGGRCPVALLPADHWIPDADIFRQQLQAAFAYATTTGEAVTFGIIPSRPEIGYGYLETTGEEVGDSKPEAATAPPLRGLRFEEKPDLPTAESYLAGGRHYWNSGIFVWDSTAFAEALAEHLPAMAELLSTPIDTFGSPAFVTALTTAYDAIEAISIDFGIMEKLPAFAVYKAAFDWSDLGSWDVWGGMAPELAGDNHGRTDLYPLDSAANYVYAPQKTVALIGVDNLIVVDTPDALLICHTDAAQRIKEITTRLEQNDREELL